ncbi:MAG: winged helix-turn-helix transcriptional regulator [Dehalococcoidia bacterium]|nr:winged helix-turn-helix transcriptional regulator [Dehalococcoidia bacterium]
MDRWTFLTNHARVLLCIAEDPAIRLREMSARVGITERATQRILADLVDRGYVSRVRIGRRNNYEVHPEMPFRHEAERTLPIGVLLSLIKHE